MSLNKKSDVKSHLSARRQKTLLPFRPTVHPHITGNSEEEPRDENGNTPVPRQKSGLESYVVTPTTPRENPAKAINSLDKPAVMKPQA